MCNLLSFMLTPFHFSFSYNVSYLAQGSTEVRVIDHTINQNFRYRLIYIFEYDMCRTRLVFCVIESWSNVLAWIGNPSFCIKP
ncbi:Protein SST2 [Gossypium arboreum]|uniref:Protein SST2 n=1 Tax=Gossypium arboreum TaxID=29729 RepID=A0A0B0NVE3_GOSAR|nr:Protein SST2 [Gossypium arboreum]